MAKIKFEMTKKKVSLEKKLEKIRKTLNVPVIFRVGMRNPEQYDLIDIQIFPKEEEDELEETKIPSYIG